MTSLQSFALNYILNSLWQVPLIFAAAWIAARAVRRFGPAIEHRVWVSALMLELFLPACSFAPGQITRALSQFFRQKALTPSPLTHITITTAGSTAHSFLQLPATIAAAILVVYSLTLCYFLARFLWTLSKTASLHRNAQPIALTGAAAQTWQRCSNLFAVHDAQAATSPAIQLPMTLGLRRRTVLWPAHLPDALLPEDLDAAIAHEFAHMRRRDFAKNLAYTVLSLPIAFHPLLWLTRSRIEATREMVCDAMAADAIAGSQRYARSLLRFASLLATDPASPSTYAIGIFNSSILERRIMSLTQHRIPPRNAARITIAAACVLLGLAACTSALALRIPIQQSTDASNSALPHTQPIVVSTKNPEYPPRGRAQKISGDVEVSLIVDKDGIPTNVSIKRSLRPDFDKSAIAAVKQYRFKPALSNGKPVDCPLFIDVNFQIF